MARLKSYTSLGIPVMKNKTIFYEYKIGGRPRRAMSTEVHVKSAYAHTEEVLVTLPRTLKPGGPYEASIS